MKETNLVNPEQKPKTVDDLQKEYAQLCYKAGSIQYEISMKKKDLEMINESLKNINFEAAALQAQAAKAAAEQPQVPNLLNKEENK